MKRIVTCLIFFLSSNWLAAESESESAFNLALCFKMSEVEQVGKELHGLLHQEFCAQQVAPQHFAPVSRQIFSKLMKESFLGANPPENWEELTNDIITNCLQNKNVCKKEARQEFQACIKPKIPLLLIQYGPWVAEKCNQLNRALIKDWPNKKAALLQTIKESKKQLNSESL